MNQVRSLILPVAGLGKRLYPLTLKTPKALIKANGKTLIEYVLEETRGTSIKRAVLVINPIQKDFFRKHLAQFQKKFKHLQFFLRTQDAPLGTGDAILPAEDLIKKEPFGLRFCDDIFYVDESVTKSLLNSFSKLNSSILILRRIPKNKVSRFGVVAAEKLKSNPQIYRISKIIEKPKQKDAPSNLVIMGAYILLPSILKQMKFLKRAKGGFLTNDCLPITDGFEREIKSRGKIFGLEFSGEYLDCGTIESLDKASRFLANHRNFGVK